MTVIRFGGAQTQGARDYQEDAWRVEKAPGGGLLAVLCDGMGGHAGGAVASEVAVDAFVSEFLETTRPPGAKTERLLQQSLAAANRAIAAKVEDEPHLDGMGCTLVGVHVDAGAITWISVGDSPFWTLRDGALVRMNADHSMKAVFDRLVELGDMTREEAATDRRRNVLRSAVSGGETSLVDLGAADFEPSMVLILASDGVESLEEDAIAGIVRDSDPEGGAERIVDAVNALNKPHQDNATVIILSTS